MRYASSAKAQQKDQKAQMGQNSETRRVTEYLVEFWLPQCLAEGITMSSAGALLGL